MNKSMILAALVGAAFALGACGTQDAPNDTVITSVEPFQAESNSGFTSREDEFLFDVATHMTPALNNESQSDVVNLGYSICTAFEGGVSLEQIIRTGVQNGLTAHDTSVVAAAATVNFCPKSRDSL